MDETNGTTAEQLSAVSTGVNVGNQIGRQTRDHDALFGTAVGLLIAALLAVVVYVYPTGVPWPIGPSTVLYGVGIGVVGAVYRMRRTGSSLLSARRYRVGFFATMGLYAVGVVLSVLQLAFPLWFWVPYIVVTALPLVISSNLGAFRER